MSSNQSKIPTTTRIRWSRLSTLYVSYSILQMGDIKEHLVQLQQNIWAPKKGSIEPLRAELLKIASKKPELFAKSSIAILRG